MLSANADVFMKTHATISSTLISFLKRFLIFSASRYRVVLALDLRVFFSRQEVAFLIHHMTQYDLVMREKEPY